MPKSSSVAGDHVRAMRPRHVASPCTVTPASRSAGTTRGRNSSATSACTSRDSAALQTRGRCVLELSRIASAMSRSASRVDVHVAVADAGLDHRHRRLLDDRPDQPGAAARDQHVDQPAGPHQLLDRLAARPPAPAGSTSAGRPASAAASRSTATIASLDAAGGGGAAQQHRVAGLQADAGRVDGHVRAGLVDDADHAERHPDLAQLEAVRQRGAADHLADRVGQRGHVARARRPSRRPGRRPARSRSTSDSAVPASRAAATSFGVRRDDRRRCPPTRASAIACSAASLVAREASASAWAASRARTATASKVIAPRVVRTAAESRRAGRRSRGTPCRGTGRRCAR